MQQTYRRLASTASSTSRSASSSMHAPYPPSTLSRSSSTASITMSPTVVSTVSTMTPVNVDVGGSSFGRMNSLRNSSFATSTSDYTRAELETIAESLLAHVHFGPYHLASSPVPSSHLRHAMSTNAASTTTSTTSSTNTINPNGGGGGSSAKENTALSGSSTSISSLYESTTPTLGQLGGGPRYGGPSSRRHFEGKEGPSSLRSNKTAAARFTIGESERGRGIGRKSVGLSMRDVNHNSNNNNNNNNDYDHYERGRRENRGRSGSVKGLQYS